MNTLTNGSSATREQVKPLNSADTSVSLLLRILFSDAQIWKMTYGIAIDEGLGKSFTAAYYATLKENVYIVACREDMNRRTFLDEILTASGIDAQGFIPQIMETLKKELPERKDAIIIIDDAHKLKDRVLHLAVVLANSLFGNVGVILMGTSELRTRIVGAHKLQQPGFDEYYNHIQRRFISLRTLGPKDIENVCRANGVTSDEDIAVIKEHSEGNLHSATDIIRFAKNIFKTFVNYD